MDPTAPLPLETVLAHEGFVRAVARAVLGGDEGVDDVVQETWIVALRRSPRSVGAMRAWLGSIARNLAYGVLRRNRARSRREAAVAPAEALASAAEIAAHEETRRRLMTAVLALDEPYRTTIRLRYYHDLPVAEVAARLGVPPETAKTRVRRGLQRLRDSLRLEERTRPRGAVAFLGILVMKKAALAVVLLALAIAAWRAGPEADRSEPPTTAAIAPAAEPEPLPPLLASGREHTNTASPDAAPQPQAAPIAPKPRIARSHLSGRVHLAPEEIAEGWVIHWRGGSEIEGIGNVGEDGSFDLDLPGQGHGAYEIFLRHRRALPPSYLAHSSQRFSGIEPGVLLEPDPVESFRVELLDTPVPESGSAVHVVHHLTGGLRTRFDVPAGTTSFQVEGLEPTPAGLYTVFVGPTPEGLYAFAQGRPTTTEALRAPWSRGWSFRGRVQAREAVERGSLRLLLESTMGFVLEQPLAELGEFEVVGLLHRAVWLVHAEARTPDGTTLRSNPVQALPRDDITIDLLPAKTPPR